MSNPNDVRLPDAREALIGRERVRGAMRVIAEGTDAAAVTADEIAQVAADVDLFAKHHQLSRKVIARAVGYDSPGVISEFVAGKYAGNAAQLAIDLDGWLVEEEQRRSRPATTHFVWTNVAQEIKATAYYCLDGGNDRKIGLVYGPDTTGIGKTTALRAIHEELGVRRSSLVTIDEVDSSPSGLLRKLCAAVHVSDSGCCRDRFARVVDKIRGRSHLLLVDQIQNLRWAREDKPLYILADLHDATRATAAQLWCGTADMLTYLDRQRVRKADESLAQIRRRIFPRIDLMEALRSGGDDGGGDMLVTVDQVREMFARNKLKLTGTASRFLCELCNQPDSGSIGLCVQLVEYATMMAERMAGVRSIDLPLLKAALRRGFSPKRAEDLLNSMEAEQREQPRAAARAG